MRSFTARLALQRDAHTEAGVVQTLATVAFASQE